MMAVLDLATESRLIPDNVGQWEYAFGAQPSGHGKRGKKVKGREDPIKCSPYVYIGFQFMAGKTKPAFFFNTPSAWHCCYGSCTVQSDECYQYILLCVTAMHRCKDDLK